MSASGKDEKNFHLFHRQVNGIFLKKFTLFFPVLKHWILKG
jgi:hypothetical protein